MDHEPQRLQKLYAGMSDGELLKLAESKDELTEVAQQAVDAEMVARGLAAPEHEGKFGAHTMTSDGQMAEDPWLSPRAKGAVPEGEDDRSEAEKDPSLVTLMTFGIAREAEKALHELDDHGIRVTMEPAKQRLTEDAPRIKTNWLTIFVEKTQHEESKDILRKSMGLFPVLAPDEVLHLEEDGEGEEVLLPVGYFDVAADVALVRKALTDAGIWFKVAEKEEDGLAADEDTATIEVRAKDLDRAMVVIEAAFGEAE